MGGADGHVNTLRVFAFCVFCGNKGVGGADGHAGVFGVCVCVITRVWEVQGMNVYMRKG